jgi:hypothetical protein
MKPSVVGLVCGVLGLLLLFWPAGNTSQPNQPTNPIVTPDKALVEEAAELIALVKASSVSKEKKLLASELWLGASDMWALADVTVNSDKVAAFNKDLLSIYGKKYPELAGSFPGFSAAVDKLFSKVVGEYPKPLTKADCKTLSDLYYVIGWALQQ